MWFLSRVQLRIELKQEHIDFYRNSSHQVYPLPFLLSLLTPFSRMNGETSKLIFSTRPRAHKPRIRYFTCHILPTCYHQHRSYTCVRHVYASIYVFAHRHTECVHSVLSPRSVIRCRIENVRVWKLYPRWDVSPEALTYAISYLQACANLAAICHIFGEIQRCNVNSTLQRARPSVDKIDEQSKLERGILFAISN